MSCPHRPGQACPQSPCPGLGSAEVCGHVAAWRSWRARVECGGRAAAASPFAGRPHGGRLRVGLWTPGLWLGGAESWMLQLARSVDPGRVSWSGLAVADGDRAVDPRQRAAFEGLMPVSGAPGSLRALAAASDVVVSWAVVDVAATLAGLPRRPRVVQVSHLPGEAPWPPGTAGLLAGVDHHVGVSELAIDPLPPALRPAARVIWNAVDPARLEAGRDRATMLASWGLPPGARVAGFLGRLHPEKGPGLVAEMAPLLPAGWHAVGVGDGPLLDQLDAGPGTWPGGDVASGDVLGAFDALLVPSRYESFGLTLAEGLWLGVPVISKPVGLARLVPGLTREVPADATGADLAEALRADLADPGGTAARVARARAFARERLAPGRFGREWTGLLCGVAGVPARPGVDPGLRDAVLACEHRGGVLPVSMQAGCGCSSGELSECRSGRGAIPGRVTLKDCFDCRSAAATGGR